ncbi:hypothetical protein ACROYT_G010878 [Oculina patagonica]
MAPNRSCQTETMMIVQPTLIPAQFEESPFKVEKTSRITRCSSLSFSEEEEGFVLGRTEYVRSLASWKKTTSCSLFSVDMGTLNSERWPGVSSGLDEDERREKVKQRVAMELEEKKEAVENDDKSICWQQQTGQTLDTYKFTDEKKNTWKSMILELEAKQLKAENKAKEDRQCYDLLTIPYSIQESVTAPDSTLRQVEPPSTSPDSSEVQEIFPTKDEVSSNDDWAEVKLVEELKLDEKETQHKSLFRRHAVRKVKRSIWSIIEPDPPPVQRKRRGKTRKTVQTRKPRQQRNRALKQSFPSSDETKESITIQNVKPSASKRKRANSPVRNEPKDSGVDSDGSSSGSSGGYNGSSGRSIGNFPGGNGSTGGSGGQGNAGDGDEDDKKKELPWWYLPGGQNNAANGTGKKKKTKDEEEDHGGEEKMEVDYVPVSKTTGFQMFLPSKVDNAEQCHSPGEEEPSTTSGKIFENVQGDFIFSPQDLQHACYCSNLVCHNIKCKQVKAEVDHMKVHKGWKLCGRCVNTRNTVKQHANVCRRTGCRVPDCESLRSKNDCNADIDGEPVLLKIRKVSPPAVPQQFAWMPPRTLYCTPLTTNQIDGKVIFRNSTLLPETYFAEHIDYNVMRRNKLGNGSNGNIYSICMQSDMNKKMALKETNYPIPKEEVEVYKALGEHEHIVTHYGGTFKGSHGHANIFMEKCEQSLYQHMEAMQRRLTVDEAMFYWLQIHDAVEYLHNLPEPVIHKDIKAKNVLLTAEGSRAKLADFDSAKRLPHELTEAGLKPLGTKGFASPEVLEKKPHGRPADVYSLACFLLELTVGVPSQETLRAKIESLQELNPDLALMVQACVRYKPEERPTARGLLRSWKSGSC